MIEALLVFVGSALGGMARFGLSGLVGRRVGETFPWGTLVVNASGTLLIGFAVAATAGEAGGYAAALWHLAVIGFLGSYTTVSAFSLQTLALAQAGESGRAIANVVLSLGLCLSATGIGLLAGACLAGTA
jgi:fluoride exporter